MHRTRAYYFGYRDWKLAADEFARARELCPSDYHLWGLEAVSRLAAGDAQAYRRLCAKMQTEFAATQNPYVANEVVFAAVMLPDASPDWGQLTTLARTAARLHQGNDRVLGAALYRAGKYDEAIRHLEHSARFYRPRAWEWCFRALAHHQCGQEVKARCCLEEARRWISEADRQSRVDLATQMPMWDGFLERFEFTMLYLEAEAVLTRPRAKGSQPLAADAGLTVEVAGPR